AGPLLIGRNRSGGGALTRGSWAQALGPEPSAAAGSDDRGLGCLRCVDEILRTVRARALQAARPPLVLDVVVKIAPAVGTCVDIPAHPSSCAPTFRGRRPRPRDRGSPSERAVVSRHRRVWQRSVKRLLGTSSRIVSIRQPACPRGQDD